MIKAKLNQGLLSFLQSSPTPFHAVQEMVGILEKRGYQRLAETDHWQLDEDGKYFVTRNDSAIVAFNLANKDIRQAGLRMIGAHTDSPSLKVKPEPEITSKTYCQLGVEVYGGALLNPWFDRDLSLAGRISFADGKGALRSTLIDFKEPIATIPSLAIHLDREANTIKSVNAQKDLPLVLGLSGDDESWKFRDLLGDQLASRGIEFREVLDYELYAYDTQPPAITGLKQEFIASARLDNLLSCYVGLQALIGAESQGAAQPALLVCNDHEEVGSASTSGAQGTLLKSVLSRLVADSAELGRIIANSLMISVDNAHGVHPNFADKHDENHGPIFNQGPVIKVNASQRYASNSETCAFFRLLCHNQKVPVQSFVVRSDMGCGSTIGPISATEIGVRTLDIGVPTFAMHSIRELAGTEDSWYLLKALTAFYQAADLSGSDCV